MKSTTVKNLTELKSFASKILQQYKSHRIFALYGLLGTGKTAFVKKAIEILDAEEEAVSPSFSIINEYFSKKHGNIYHFDLYRIQNITEIFDLGYEEYFYNNHYCFIEWPQLIEPLLPDNYLSLYFSLQENGSRKVLIKK